IAEVGERQVVKKQAIVIERAHFESVVKQTNAGTEVFKRVVGVLIAVDFTGAVSELDGGVNIVVARIDSFGLPPVVLRASEGRKHKHGGKQNERKCANHPAT